MISAVALGLVWGSLVGPFGPEQPMGPAETGPAETGHPGPPFYLQFEIDAGEVRLMFSGEQRPLGPYLGFEGTLDAPLAEVMVAQLMEVGQALFAERAVLIIDGVPVTPELDQVQAFDSFGPGNPEPSLQFDLVYPCEGTPSTVTVTWSIFDEGGDEGIPTLFRQVDGFFEFTALGRDEPTYTWHGRDQILDRPEHLPRPVPAAPPRRLRYPLLSAGMLLAVALATPFLRRRGRGGTALLSWALVLPAALLLRGVGTEPPWGGRVLMPSAEQAVAMFRQLHGNIYRAMGAQSQEEIYAVLASSVDEDQLDELYGEVYESLVLREDGGAFCTISEVTPVDHVLHMDSDVRSEEDLIFEIDWSWRVRGTVIHFAHQHERINAYRALYTVAYDGEAWKIASWEVLEHRRIEDGGEEQTLVGPEDS